jgi:hypothetical protein
MYPGSSGAGRIHLQKFGFLEEKLNSALEKNASKRAKGRYACVDKFRVITMGKRFELRTDHSGLKYIFEQPTFNSRKMRWMEFLSEYDFDIKHIKGKENKVVDALTRRVHLMHATSISMHQLDLKIKILDVVVTDKHYLQEK